jgi:hypothetical protein
LKRLAEVKWGSSQETLKKNYQIYIKPVITYGSEVPVTANSNNVNRLEIIQNRAPRMITGTVKTTPVAALQQYTGNIPIVEEIKKQSANIFVTIKALEDQTWIETKPKIKLTTQNDPVNVITNLLDNLGIPTQVKKEPN